MMDDDKILLISIISTVIILVISFLIVYSIGKQNENKRWNNGKCECGGDWVYEQAVGHSFYTSYLYRCNQCGKTIEVERVEK